MGAGACLSFYKVEELPWHVPAGAMDAKMPVGGIRISREAGTTVRTASYLPTECAVFCRFLSSRKVSSSRGKPPSYHLQCDVSVAILKCPLHCPTCQLHLCAQPGRDAAVKLVMIQLEFAIMPRRRSALCRWPWLMLG